MSMSLHTARILAYVFIGGAAATFGAVTHTEFSWLNGLLGLAIGLAVAYMLEREADHE